MFTRILRTILLFIIFSLSVLSTGFLYLDLETNPNLLNATGFIVMLLVDLVLMVLFINTWDILFETKDPYEGYY